MILPDLFYISNRPFYALSCVVLPVLAVPVGYTGQDCSASFLEEFFSETRKHEKSRG